MFIKRTIKKQFNIRYINLNIDVHVDMLLYLRNNNNTFCPIYKV